MTADTSLDSTTGRDNPIPFPAELDDIETAAARATVQITGGNKSEAARRLGISRARLRRLLEGEMMAAGTSTKDEDYG